MRGTVGADDDGSAGPGGALGGPFDTQDDRRSPTGSCAGGIMTDIHCGEWRPVPGEPGCEFRLVGTVTPVDGQPEVTDYEACLEVRRASDDSGDAAGGRAG